MNPSLKLQNNVLVVGNTEVDRSIYSSYGFNVVEHWKKVPVGARIPANVDTVVLISDKVDTYSARELRAECDRSMIALVYTHASMERFQESVVKAKQNLDKQLEATFNLEMRQMADNTDVTVDGRTNGKNVQRTSEKVELLRSILRENPLTSTETIQAQIMAKFGKSLTPTTITQVRWEEFNTKFGPRGKVIHRTPSKKKLTIQDIPDEKPVQAPVAAPTPVRALAPTPTEQSGNEKLTQIIQALKAEMSRAHITSLTLPVDGAVKATFAVERDLDLGSLRQ